MNDRQAHYLRPAGSTRIPRQHLALDVEARTGMVNGLWQQSWRLACGDYFTGHVERGWKLGDQKTWHKPLDLWVDVNSRVGKDRRLVVWCHNLAYDMRVSGALNYLPAFGFELEGIALEHVAGWARFTRGTSTVLMVDLASWLPAPLSKVAQDLGTRQPPRPGDDASTELHEHRCREDVRVAREAVMQIMDLIESEDLGPWRPTGAGQSHSAWRRRFYTHRCLVHDHLEALDAERHASWTGRAEAWRHGELDHGPYTEFDLSLAYCQIAADSQLPAVFVGEAASTDPAWLSALSGSHAILSKVTVTTDVPLVPTMGDEHILWPTGTFDTVLWDPELAMLTANDCDVTVHQAWVYRKAPVLAEASQWVIDKLANLDGSVTAVQHRMLKHWARTLVGRCALRYRIWEKWGTAEDEDVTLGMYHDWDTGNVSEMMQVGNQLRVLSEQQESPDSMPQIPGWVMSECRRRLWATMCVAGLDHVVYVDTDSIITDSLGTQRIQRWLSKGGGWPTHIKGTYQKLTIHGPRMLTVDDERRMAGVPLQAYLDKSGQLRGEVFVSLRESLLRHQVDSVEVLQRRFDPGGSDRRRQHLDWGRTTPYVLPKAT